MADYRLYGLDGVDKVASGMWLEADDDQAAIEAAKEMMDGHDCELWQGRRRVARIPHQRESKRPLALARNACPTGRLLCLTDCVNCAASNPTK